MAIALAEAPSRQRILGTRSRRVGVLLIAIMVLSIADLIVTLVHLQTTGMMEANPIAAFLIRSAQSSWLLAAYKMCTVGVCVSLLFRLRHHRSSEIAAWVGVAILSGMAVIWYLYSQQVAGPIEIATVSSVNDQMWLRLQ